MESKGDPLKTEAAIYQLMRFLLELDPKGALARIERIFHKIRVEWCVERHEKNSDA